MSCGEADMMPLRRVKVGPREHHNLHESYHNDKEWRTHRVMILTSCQYTESFRLRESSPWSMSSMRSSETMGSM